MLDAALAAETESAAAADPSTGEQVIGLIVGSSGPVFAVVWVLIIASVAVWFIAVLKLLQLRRMSSAQHRFEQATAAAEDADHLFDIAHHHRGAPGARVVFELQKRRDTPQVLESAAKRAIVSEQKRASTMLQTLASIGSASPFIGLFGTVYGIMDAFLRIGREKSASLPVVAPAIGEALIATAIGLFAAIPAVVAYNAISKRMDDLLSEVEASAEGWVAIVNSRARRSVRPPAAEATGSQALPLAHPRDTPVPHTPHFPGA